MTRKAFGFWFVLTGGLFVGLSMFGNNLIRDYAASHLVFRLHILDCCDGLAREDS